MLEGPAMNEDGKAPQRGKASRSAKPDKVDPEQFQRFLETARELGCEDNLDRFDEAVKRIGKARQKPPQTKAAAKKSDKER
jgi:hypothetical protein